MPSRPSLGSIVTPSIARSARLADERSRLNHALRSAGLVLLVDLPLKRPKSADPEGGGTNATRTYRLVGVRDDLTCEFIRADTRPEWGLVHLALPCSPESPFWQSALAAAGVEPRS